MFDQKNAIGCMVSEIPHPNLAVLFKNNGMDFIIVDTEHGGFDYAALSGIIMTARLCQLPVIIRLPDSARRDVTRLADMGADGFLLPMTHTRQDIERLIYFAQYPPVGKRGISITRAHAQYRRIELNAYMEEANQNMRIFAQIESRQGLENLHDIVGAEGVSGVFLGPNDLASDLGCRSGDRLIHEMIEKTAAGAREAGLASGIITTDDSLLATGMNCGMQMICVGSELSMLRYACREINKKYRKHRETEAQDG